MNRLTTFLDNFKLDLLNDQMDCEKIHEKILSNLNIKGTTITVLFFASIIASIGLNINSLTFILGAKLLSPLMGMIIAMGYGVSTYDFKIFKGAVRRLFIQCSVILIASTLYFFISPIKMPTEQLITKTTPNIFDVLVAIFAGACAVIATTRVEKNNIMPGVAIATSLLPPLCTVGYGITRLDTTFIIGPLYLFLINVFFIMMSAVIFCKLFNLKKIETHTKSDSKKVEKAFIAGSIILITPIIISSILFSYSSYNHVKIENEFNAYISEKFSDTENIHYKSYINFDEKTVKVYIIGDTISDEVLTEIENETKVNKLNDFEFMFYQGAEDLLVEYFKNN